MIKAIVSCFKSWYENRRVNDSFRKHERFVKSMSKCRKEGKTK